MRSILLIVITVLIIIFTSKTNLNAQGCVAIRGNASTCMLSHPEHTNKALVQAHVILNHSAIFQGP